MHAPRSGKAQGVALGALALLILGGVAFLFLQSPDASKPGPGPDPVTQPSDPVSRGQLTQDPGHVRDPGQQPGRVEVESIPEQATPFLLGLGAPVSGRVVNESGRGVPGAKVWITERFKFGQAVPRVPPTEDPRFFQVTDAQGGFRLDRLEAGRDLDLWAWHPDYAARAGLAFAALAVEPQILPPIVLAEGAVIRGAVQDKGGNPVFAQVELGLQDRTQFRTGTPEEQRDQDLRLGKLRAIPTDDRGLFEFRNVAEGAIWSLRASAEGYATAEIQALLVQPDHTLPDQVLVMDSEHVLSGIVLSDERVPVAGAVITVSRTQPRPVFSTTGRSNQDGSFTIRGLPQGIYGMAGQAPGFGNGRVPRTETDTAPVEIVLPKLGGVSGRVTDSGGRPVLQFSLELMRTRRNTAQYAPAEFSWQVEDPDGNYKLEGLDPGTYVLLVRADSHSPTYSPGFHVQRDVVLGMDIQLRLGGSVSGLVTDAQGAPLAGARVSLHGLGFVPASGNGFFGVDSTDPDNVPQTGAISGSDGRFTVQNAVPGELKLYVEHGKHLPEMIPVTIKEGGGSDAGRIALQAGGVVFGSATDAAGQPMSGGTVTLTSLAGSDLFLSALLDARGRFRFEGLRAGDYEILSFPGGGNEIFFPNEADKQRIYVSEGRELEVSLKSTTPR